MGHFSVLKRPEVGKSLFIVVTSVASVAMSILSAWLIAFGHGREAFAPLIVFFICATSASCLLVSEAAIAKACGGAQSFLVFHGGSGSSLQEIHETLDYGVIKMNIDTDTQYAFTRAIADHMFKNYDGVLKIDGEVGNKKTYDPRPYMKKAEQSMADRVIRACNDLRSAGKTMGKL